MQAGAGREEEEEGPWDVVLHQLHGMDECEEFMLLTGACLLPHFIWEGKGESRQHMAAGLGFGLLVQPEGSEGSSAGVCVAGGALKNQ